jgi:hypothetical protein
VPAVDSEFCSSRRGRQGGRGSPSYELVISAPDREISGSAGLLQTRSARVKLCGRSRGHGPGEQRIEQAVARGIPVVSPTPARPSRKSLRRHKQRQGRVAAAIGMVAAIGTTGDVVLIPAFGNESGRAPRASSTIAKTGDQGGGPTAGTANGSSASRSWNLLTAHRDQGVFTSNQMASAPWRRREKTARQGRDHRFVPPGGDERDPRGR